MSTLYAKVLRDTDLEANFIGNKLELRQFAFTSDTKALVIRDGAGAYHFIRQFNEETIRELINALDRGLSAHISDLAVHVDNNERETWNNKQNRLTQGDNITIIDNVISGKDWAQEIENEAIERMTVDAQLQSQLDTLYGSIIYLGRIALNTNDVTQEALNDVVRGLNKWPPQKGYCLIDYQNNDWIYDGETWVNVGYFDVSQATNSSLGVVKGSNESLKVSVDSQGEMSVNGLQEAIDEAVNNIGDIGVGGGINRLIYLGQIDKDNPTEQELNDFAETKALNLFGKSELKTGYTVRDANNFDWRFVDEAYIPILKYSVTGSVTGNGSLTGLGDYFVGETVTINTIPASGQELKSLLIDGTQRTSPYTFTMPKRNVSITVVFGAVSVPVKSISVGSQSSNVIAGNTGNITLPVTTSNIANGTYTPTVSGLPAGVTVSGNVTITAGSGTLTLAVANADTGTSSVTLTIDSTTSAAFSVVVARPAISIVTQPNATNVTQGSISGSLSIVATSDSTPSTLSYQWYSNSSNSNSNGTAINGATSDSYTIPTGLTAGSYYYYCVASGSKGETSVASNVAVVTVSNAIVKTVSVGSQSGALAGTGSATFTVTTSNIPNGTYNVSVANLPANVSAEAVTISAGTGTLTLTATNAQASVTSTLTLTIDGVTSSAFTLTITAAQPAGRVEVLILNEQQQTVTLTSTMIANGIRLLSGATFTSAHKLSGYNVTGSNYTTSYKHSTSSTWSTASSSNWVGLTAEEIRGGQYMDINFTGSPATIVVQSYGW
jgi:hypothetical protein